MDKKAKFSSPLTNEALTKKFRSSFELVNYAIKLAENMIKTGRDSRVESEVQSRAMLILEEIAAGKDFLDKNLDFNAMLSEREFVFDDDLKPHLIYEGEGYFQTDEIREE